MRADIIKTVADDIRSKGFKVVFIGAFGSYNYNLVDQSSDLDLKVVVDVPIERKILEKTVRSKERHFLYSNATPKIECYLVTLTEFIYELSVFDVLFLEALFSRYCYVTNLFEPYYKNLKGYMTSCLLANRHKLYSNYLSMADRINKSFANSMFDPNGHKSYHILRFYDLIQKFESDHNYTNALMVQTQNSSAEFIARVSGHKYNRLDAASIKSDALEYLSNIETLVHQHSDKRDPNLLKATTECLIDMCTSIRASIYGVKQEQLIAKVYKSLLRKQESISQQLKYDSRFKLDVTKIPGELIPYVEHVDVGTDPNETYTLIIDTFAEHIGEDMMTLSNQLRTDCIQRTIRAYKREDCKNIVMMLLIIIVPVISALATHILSKY